MIRFSSLTNQFRGFRPVRSGPLYGRPAASVGGIVRAAGRPPAAAAAPLGEALEDRTLLTTYVVDSMSDGAGDGDGSLDGSVSLREAVIAAATNAAFGDAPAGDADGTDRITFADSVSAITLTGELGVGDGGTLLIDGGGDVTISGDGSSRLFNVTQTTDGESTVIRNIALTGGASDGDGGAIHKDGDSQLVLRGVTFEGNTAADGGAVFANGGRLLVFDGAFTDNAAAGDDDSAGSGGAIYVRSGDVRSRGTTYAGNTAPRAGGAVELEGGGFRSLGDTYDSNVAGSDETGSAGAPGNGGALHVTDSDGVMIRDAVATGNLAAAEGGAFWNNAGTTMKVRGAEVTGNTANGGEMGGGGGGLYNNGGTLLVLDSVIEGNTAVAGAGSGGGVLSTDGFTFVGDSSVSGNTASRAGGGVEVGDGRLTLRNVKLDSNAAAGNPDAGGAPGNGGGLHSTFAARVFVLGGTVDDNRAASEGGGLWNAEGGRMVVRGGTVVSGNVAEGDDADAGGGGIYSDGGMLLITDAEISGNHATGDSGSGGGILSAAGTLTVSDTVIAANTANRAGGGIEIIAGDARLTDVTLGGAGDADGNITGPAGGARDGAPGNGGGLHVTGDGDDGTTQQITIDGGTVAGNLAANEGGGLWNQAGVRMLLRGGVVVENNTARGDDPDVDTFVVDLQTLNAAYGSTASGGGVVTVDRSGQVGGTEGEVFVRVRLRADGLEDLTGVEGGIHVAHIHGQFEGNAERPLAEQGDGPFFDGEGGVATGFPPADSALPSAEEDGDLNVDETARFGRDVNYLDFFEGRPSYGPVVLNLTGTQLDLTDGVDDGGEAAYAPDGTPPLSYFFQLAGAGTIDPAALFPSGTTYSQDTTYEFDLSDPDQRRQFNNIGDPGLREIVLHGLTVPTEISEAIDENTGAEPGTPTAGVPLGDGTSFRRTAPVAAGEVRGAGVDGSATAAGAGDGGGLFNNGGDVFITGGAAVRDNDAAGASGSGGGVFSTDGFVFVRNASVTGNTANRAGGGVELVDGRLTVVESDVSDNSAGDGDGGSPGNGGAYHVSNAAEARFLGATVTDNFAANEGGGLWNQAGSLLLVRDGLLSGNRTAGDGGGLYNNGGETDVFGSIVEGNLAEGGDGGGLFAADGEVTLRDSSVTDNAAAGDGGGIYNDALVRVLDSVVAGNRADSDDDGDGSGGGIFTTPNGTTVVRGTSDVSGNRGTGDGDDDRNDD